MLGISGSLNNISTIPCARRNRFHRTDTSDIQLICTEHSYTNHSGHCSVISTSFMHYCRY